MSAVNLPPSAPPLPPHAAGADSLAALHGLIETMPPQFTDAADADE